VWQYYAFAVLQPKGVRRWTYTNTLKAETADADAPKGKAKAA